MKKIFETITALAGMYAILYILLSLAQLGEFVAQVVTDGLTF